MGQRARRLTSGVRGQYMVAKLLSIRNERIFFFGKKEATQTSVLAKEVGATGRRQR